MIKVRFAIPDEASLIYKFIQTKAEFDRGIGAYSGVIETSEDKIRKTIFRNNPFAYVLFAEVEQNTIGFALYGFRYSSFTGQPNIWLDDLYVEQNMRSKGAGSLLMSELQQIAYKNNCTHLAWTADARNTRGLKFYYGLGAEVIEQQGDRCFFQWSLPRINH
nr:GNAT family N-acetyltransferase [Pleurocapsa sp. FMAR1]